MPGSVELSLVIPVYNERDNLPPLLEEIAVALRGASYEVVAVDDGSTDGSLPELKRLRAAHPELRVVAFERNAGQTGAFARRAEPSSSPSTRTSRTTPRTSRRSWPRSGTAAPARSRATASSGATRRGSGCRAGSRTACATG